MALFQVRPLNFYKRDREAFNRIATGTLNSTNILEIEYGEFPLKGIDIVQTNERPVHVRSYFKDKNTSKFFKVLFSLLTFGYVHGKKISAAGKEVTGKTDEDKHDRAIYLNKLLVSPFGQYYIVKAVFLPAFRTLRHAVKLGLLTKSMSVAASYLSLAAAAVAKAVTFPLLVLPSSRAANITQLLTFPFRAAMDTIGHEHVHVLQVHDENKTGFQATKSGRCKDLVKIPKNPLLRVLYAIDALVSLGVVPYLRNDAEIQARMHTVLAKGYRNKWHQLPATRHEIWGALISMGLKAPESIRRELDESREEGLARFYQKGAKGAFNRVAGKCMNQHVAELNAAYASLFLPGLKERYWREIVPLLYGHLVELYGDPQGRARMGIVQETQSAADILRQMPKRLVKLSEVMKRSDEIEAAEMTRIERFLKNWVDLPVTGLSVAFDLISGKGNNFPANTYESAQGDGEKYYSPDFLENEMGPSWTIMPALTRKIDGIFKRAIAESGDYSEDIRAGKIIPPVKL